MMFEETDAIAFTMTDGGHEYNPWSLNPDRSDAVIRCELSNESEEGRMDVFNVEMAGLPMEIKSRYEYCRWFCRDYLTDREPEFSVYAEDDNQAEYERQAAEIQTQIDEIEDTINEIYDKLEY